MSDAMLVLEDLRVAREIRLEGCLEAADVVRMNPVEPVFSPRNASVPGQPDHRSPSFRNVELSGSQAPLPEPVVGPLRRQCQTLYRLGDLALRARPLRD